MPCCDLALQIVKANLADEYAFSDWSDFSHFRVHSGDTSTPVTCS